MRGKYAKKRLVLTIDQPGSKRVCRACGHTGEEHTGKPNTSPVWCTRSLDSKPSCNACVQVLNEIYKKRISQSATTISQADQNHFADLTAQYMQRQYDALHIRRS